jgi:hypothetical protein
LLGLAVGGLAGDVVAADQQHDGHHSGEHGAHGRGESVRRRRVGEGGGNCLGRLEAVHVHFGCLEGAKMYNVQDVNVKGR